MARPRKRVTKIIGIAALSIAGLGLLAYGGYELWQWYKATHNPAPAISTSVVTESTTTPDETPPTDACESYSVANTLPRTITIESIGAFGCIEHVGIDQNKMVAVPTNIHVAGWFTRSVLPGEPGVSLIDGHVLGRYNDAIFVNLEKTKPGDEIQIEMGDKSKKTFVIKDVTSYDLVNAQTEFLKQSPDIEKQLTLITCGGTYNAQENTYDKRVIVRAAFKE